MNFSAIPIDKLWGRLLRLPFKLIPPNLKIPILQGRLRGKLWIAGSSNNGCWLGSYEYEKRLMFEKNIKKGEIMFDIGANVGFYTLLASILVGEGGKVFAFEPVPRNLQYLHKHMQMNRIGNVSVFEEAISDSAGVVSFEEDSYHSLGHFSQKGSLKVKTVSLDELVLQGRVPVPDCVKIDVEGAEMLVLSGGKELFTKKKPLIFLATHGQDLHDECCRLLKTWGYRIEGIREKESTELIAYPL